MKQYTLGQESVFNLEFKKKTLPNWDLPEKFQRRCRQEDLCTLMEVETPWHAHKLQM